MRNKIIKNKDAYEVDYFDPVFEQWVYEIFDTKEEAKEFLKKINKNTKKYLKNRGTDYEM